MTNWQSIKTCRQKIEKENQQCAENWHCFTWPTSNVFDPVQSNILFFIHESCSYPNLSHNPGFSTWLPAKHKSKLTFCVLQDRFQSNRIEAIEEDIQCELWPVCENKIHPKQHNRFVRQRLLRQKRKDTCWRRRWEIATIVNFRSEFWARPPNIMLQKGVRGFFKESVRWDWI